MRASAGEFGLILKPLNLVVLKNKNKKNPLLSLSDGQRTALIRSSGSRRPLERVADLAAKCVNS